jgi:Short C-terminal domain
MRIFSSTIAGLFASLALAGTIAGCGGRSADVKPVTSTTATGQQLVTLKKALDAGTITQDEYDKERARILKGN